MLPAIYAWLAKAVRGDHRVLWLSDFSDFVSSYVLNLGPPSGKMFSTTYVYIVLVQKAIARLTRLVAIGAALIG